MLTKRRKQTEPFMFAFVAMTIICYLYVHVMAIETIMEKLLWLGASMMFCGFSVFTIGIFLGLTVAKNVIRACYYEKED